MKSNTLTEAFFTSLPWGVGNFINKLFYDNSKTIEKKIDEIKKIIMPFVKGEEKKLLDSNAIEFVSEFNNLFESQKDKINLELLDKISIYKTGTFEGVNMNESFEKIKIDILNKFSYNKTIFQSITLPPFISHLQLNLLSNLMFCSALGFKVVLLILDEPYNTYKSQRNIDGIIWPSKTNALSRLYNFIEILPSRLNLSKIILQNICIKLESDLYEEGETKTKCYKNFKDNLASKRGLSEQLNKTSLYYSGSYQEIAFQENLIREYYFGTITFKASYIFAGEDRLPLWNYFNKVMSILEPASHTYLLINKIPSATGTNDVRLDSNMLFIDNEDKNEYGRIDITFINWFKENINHSSSEKTNSSDIEMIRHFFKDLNESIPNSSAISILKGLESLSEIISCYCFGGFEFLNKLNAKEDVFIYNFNGDIDLLFIVKSGQKNYRVAYEINKSLLRFGKVTFHPDFYSKRKSNEVNFDIIILPENSNYFNKFGTLTWLSAFEINKYHKIFGPKEKELKSLVRYPDSKIYKNMRDRIYAYKSCHYGINYMQSQLFPHIVKGNPQIDYKRIFKYLTYDFYWVLTGEFKNNFNEVLIFLQSNFKQELKTLNGFDKDLNYTDKKLAILSYDLILEIKKELKKSTLPNTTLRQNQNF